MAEPREAFNKAIGFCKQPREAARLYNDCLVALDFDGKEDETAEESRTSISGEAA